MKHFCAAIFIVAWLTGAAAQAGKDTDNGGNDVGLEFTAIAEEALKHLAQSGLPDATRARLTRLRKALRSAKILAVENPIVIVRDGVRQSCVAVNDPIRKVIKVSKKWDSISSLDIKSALTIHELEGLLREESTGVYVLSAEYLRWLNFSGDPAAALENGNQPQGISIVGLTGASSFVVSGLGPNKGPRLGAGVMTVYGGIAGVAFNLQPSPIGNGLIDTCANAVILTPCNNRAITSSTVLTVSFKSDSIDGVPGIEYESQGSAGIGSLPSASSEPSPVVKRGSVANYSVSWSEICTVMAQAGRGINTDCSLTQPGEPATFTFFVAITGPQLPHPIGQPAGNSDTLSFTVTITDGAALDDTSTGPNSVIGQTSTAPPCDPNTPENDVGICGFEVHARNGKVQLSGLFGAAILPNIETVPIGSVLVEWAEGRDSFLKIAPPAAASLNHDHILMPLTVDDSGTLSLADNVIPGLKKGTDYSFKIALVDLAGNIGDFTADGDPASQTGGDYSCVQSSNPHATDCHMARP